MQFFIFLLDCSANLAYGNKVVKSAADQSFYLTSSQRIFRVRKSQDPMTGLESNVVKFVPKEQQYKIIVNDEPMCVADDANTDIVSCKVSAQKETLWSLEETPNGYYIKSRGFCLTTSAYDDRSSISGYKLTLTPCEPEAIKLWKITSIEAFVANGNFEKEQLKGGRDPLVSDFMNQPLQNKKGRIERPGEIRLKEMPEKLYGFY